MSVLVRFAEDHNGFFNLWLGRSPLVIISEPEHLQVFYTNTNMLDRSESYHKLKDAVGENLFLSDGDKWKYYRKLFMTNFSSSSPELLTMNFLECSKLLMDELETYADGPFFSSNFLLHIHTANAILLSAIGEQVPRELAEKLLEGADWALDTAFNRNFQPLLHFDFIFQFSYQSKKLNEIRKFSENFLFEIAQRKRKEIEDFKMKNEQVPNLYIYKMIEQESDAVVCSELENLILGGLDTTSGAIGFTLLCLGLFPDIQQRVFEEDEEFQKLSSGRVPDSNDLQHYQYLERVIKESMRLFPLGPALGRRLRKDTAFGKYIVPKGMDIIALPIYTNRCARYFSNPLKFDPDRFLAENTKNMHPYLFNPFSAGPRGCPGQKYAYLIMKIYISGIVRKYKIISKYKNLDEAISNAETKFLLKDKNGIPIRLQTRTK